MSHPLWAPSAESLAALSWASAAVTAACLLAVGALLGLVTGPLAPDRGARLRLNAGFLAAGALGAALALCLRGSDPDWDAFSVKLERPGDRVVQEIGIAPLQRHARIEEAWIEMDLLRSVSPDFALEVRINDRPARLFDGGLGARPGDFTLDPAIHGTQDRHLRVLTALEQDVRGSFLPRYGRRSPGLDGVRRWVRVPIAPEDLMGRESVTVTLVMKRCEKGAFVRVFGDQALPARGARVYEGPAFFVNAYLQSDYRYRMLSGDRRRADYRLCFATPLESPWARSSFWDAKGRREDLSRDPGVQVGEYRVRLRVKLPGRLVFRVAGPAPVIVWSDETLPGDRVLTAKELSLERARYFDHFDGFVTY